MVQVNVGHVLDQDLHGLIVVSLALGVVAFQARLLQQVVDFLGAVLGVVQRTVGDGEVVDVLVGIGTAAPADEQPFIGAGLAGFNLGGEFGFFQRHGDASRAQHALG